MYVLEEIKPESFGSSALFLGLNQTKIKTNGKNKRCDNRCRWIYS